MEYSKKVKTVSKGQISCDGCGCTKKNCICSSIITTETTDKFVLLTHGKELSRPSNTGRIVQQTISDTCEIIQWERGKLNDKLKKLLDEYKESVYLVYPSEDSIDIDSPLFKKDNKRLFILIDATWQESKKILNRSSYLKLPTLRLSDEINQIHPFRRNADKKGISTISCIIQILKKTSPKNSSILQTNYNLYIESFKKSILGQ